MSAHPGVVGESFLKIQCLLGAVGALAMSAAVAHASPVSGTGVAKKPDLGPYWSIMSTGGTYIYANSFVAPISGKVSNIGIWLSKVSGDTSAQPIKFEVMGSAAGGGPDSSDILATTGTLALDVTNSLDLFSAGATSSSALVAGQTYWVAGDEVGLSGGGFLQTGGHTQNSGGITDNGTFWYSNDSTGAFFDGQNLTPEMAFTVSMAGGVPEPATWAMMLLGLGGLGAMMRLQRRKAGAAAVA